MLLSCQTSNYQCTHRPPKHFQVLNLIDLAPTRPNQAASSARRYLQAQEISNGSHQQKMASMVAAASASCVRSLPESCAIPQSVTSTGLPRLPSQGSWQAGHFREIHQSVPVSLMRISRLSYPTLKAHQTPIRLAINVNLSSTTFLQLLHCNALQQSVVRGSTCDMHLDASSTSTNDSADSAPRNLQVFTATSGKVYQVQKAVRRACLLRR